MYFCVILCIDCFVKFSVLFVCMCIELLPPGGYPIAVKYIISYIITIATVIKIHTVLFGVDNVWSGRWILTFQRNTIPSFFLTKYLGKI
jgi:hypothetical protein